ncbi:hypothetical protein M409DRAFT_20310 [Zasmidium cellare ATCC 36951]|uniref:Uncharacterized protein n=1 Tax=Zasmidium cellare ATCC 36951 TaxID=1080233 RepID=A0A6A6CWN4_ZASCE|nr:uncharacterized protein M409DRAFT_20310 [Zasmidium cellare ATCC 36951]KAF2169896.1 hypothetical protein M409DRAFT_20310 [Zasmidium cellare ATCC 36951]
MDPRQQRQSHGQRPPYPQVTVQAASPSSQTSSVFQSTSSLASLSSLNSAPHNPHMAESAPLPSPSMAQPNNYFSSISSSHAPTSHPTQSQRIPAQAQQAVSSPYVGQRGDTGGAPETAPHLAQFNLLAEAAKRAQMACLSRDLGDIGL